MMQPSYAEFQARIRRFFAILQGVGFTEIHVWMDGATDAQKLNTDLRRECEKYRRLEQWTASIQAEKSPNPFQYERRVDGMLGHCSYAAFVEAVRGCAGNNVRLHCARGETDHHAARHAWEINAFVLSGDSDFVVYRNGRGWISMNSVIVDGPLLDPRRPLPPRFSFVAQLYTRGILARHLGIGEELVPLFGCLAGNDYFEQGHFFRGAAPSSSAKRPMHGRHLDALVPFVRELLRGCKNTDEAIDVLQKHLGSSLDDCVGLQDTARQYNQFVVHEDSSYDQCIVEPPVMEAMMAGLLDFQLFDVVFSRQFVCSVRMGVTRGPSAYELFAGVRRGLYTLLLGDVDEIEPSRVYEYSKPLPAEQSMRRDEVPLGSRAEVATLLGDISSQDTHIQAQLIGATDDQRLDALCRLFDTDPQWMRPCVDASSAIDPWHVPIVLMARFIITRQPGYLRDFELLALILSSISPADSDDHANTNIRARHQHTNPITVPCMQLLAQWDCAAYHLMISMQVLRMHELLCEWRVLDTVRPDQFLYYLSKLRRGCGIEQLCASEHDYEQVAVIYRLCMADIAQHVSRTFAYGL